MKSLNRLPLDLTLELNRELSSSSSKFTLLLPFSLLFILLLGVISGCSSKSDGKSADYVTAYPITVPMRPGEIEKVLFSSTQSTLNGIFDRYVSINEDFPNNTDCNDPKLKCWLQDFTALDTNQSPRLGFFEFPFTGNGFLNSSPEMNDGSYQPFSIFPATTQTLPPSVRFAAGGYINRSRVVFAKFDDEPAHSLSVDSDGSVWAWGANQSGQLGNGSNTPSAVPVKVEIPESINIVAVAAGGQHSLALSNDGSVWSWGYNGYGQLGDNTDQDSNTPLQVSNLANVIAIAAGDDHSLALLNDGSVLAWGSNYRGQLGDGTQNNSATPVSVQGLTNISAISAGSRHSLALGSNGLVYGWGNDEYGQISARALAGEKIITLPQQIEGTATAIAAGGEFSLLLNSNGTVWSLGDNRFGQLGRTDSDPCTLVNQQTCPADIKRVSGLDQVLDIEAGERFAIARRSDGSVWAWGDNSYGQIAGLPGLSTKQAKQVEGLSNIIAIAAGKDHAIAMSADDACSVGDSRVGGRLMAWGNNTMGSRGDGTAVNWFRPTPVVGIGDDNSCSSLTGQRLMIYRVGTGEGSIQSSQPGLNCTGTLCWQSIVSASTVTLTATPDPGSEFINWQWDCAASSASVSMTINDAKVCKVRFNQVAQITPPAVSACSDGIDNDEDGLVDLADPGCSSADDDSELNTPVGDFTLTISITGSGEVFDNNDYTFACYSEGSNSCLQTYATNNTASLRAYSFAIEGVAIWTSGCDNGTGVLESCEVTMDRDKTVMVTMQ